MSGSPPMDDQKTKQFRWGLVLAWAPLIPLMYGCFSLLRGISTQKATGLAAVAGGLVEFLTTFGFLAFVAVELYAILLLVRSVAGGSWERRVLSILSIAWCGVVSLLVVFAVWLFFFSRHLAS